MACDSALAKGIARCLASKGQLLQSKDCLQNNWTVNAGNPVIADWVQFRLEFPEGLLGGWLAQRLAALRGKMAAGARFNFTLVSRACRGSLEHLPCHGKRFSGDLRLLVIREGSARGHLKVDSSGISLTVAQRGEDAHSIPQLEQSCETGRRYRRPIGHATVRHEPTQCLREPMVSRRLRGNQLTLSRWLRISCASTEPQCRVPRDLCRR
jgi:hypothetical protein